MSIPIRPAVEDDAAGVSRVLFEAVRQTAAPFYPSQVIEGWSPVPDGPRQAQIRRAISGTDEFCLVAEQNGEIVGFGSIVPSSCELRAVYVRPDCGRIGVGSAILCDLERVAKTRGLSELHMDASLNAEAFYRRHGYEVVGRGVRRMAGGGEMACVKMRKSALGE